MTDVAAGEDLILCMGPLALWGFTMHVLLAKHVQTLLMFEIPSDGFFFSRLFHFQQVSPLWARQVEHCPFQLDRLASRLDKLLG